MTDIDKKIEQIEDAIKIASEPLNIAPGGELAGRDFVIDRLNEYKELLNNQMSANKELLNNQMPVKPKIKIRLGLFGKIQYSCGVCGSLLYESAKFCQNCGQAVKWDV